MSALCGYCLQPTPQDAASVSVGTEEIFLCHDRDYSCYELVSVYGRPMADGRRLGTHAGVWLQLEIPYFLPGDEKVVELCGCKWKIPAPHITGCPVPAKMDVR